MQIIPVHNAHSGFRRVAEPEQGGCKTSFQAQHKKRLERRTRISRKQLEWGATGNRKIAEHTKMR